MSDDLPAIEVDFASNGAPVVIIGQVETFDPLEAIRLAPALVNPKWVRAYAQVVNHLAHGSDFDPIMDPAAFHTKYMATYDAEDPDEEVAPGAVRLHNFGIPDFTEIAPPAMVGTNLVFFAENVFMGIPYKVVMAPGAQPQYVPLGLKE